MSSARVEGNDRKESKQMDMRSENLGHMVVDAAYCWCSGGCILCGVALFRGQQHGMAGPESERVRVGNWLGNRTRRNMLRLSHQKRPLASTPFRRLVAKVLTERPGRLIDVSCEA